MYKRSSGHVITARQSITSGIVASGPAAGKNCKCSILNEEEITVGDLTIGIGGASGDQGQAFFRCLRNIPDDAAVTALCETRKDELDEAVGDVGVATYLTTPGVGVRCGI